VVAAKNVAFGSGPLGCALLGASMRGMCGEGSPVGSTLPAGSLALGVTGIALSSTPGDGPPGGARGDSSSATPPSGPTPGSSPNGASGGAAAGGGGSAAAGLITLAGFLLLTAPRAMRRLRLACRPWRAACFALIPERPG
jgi:hypothetical protein